MPAPQAMLMATDAKNHFRSKQIKLAVDWSQPTGEAGQQYVDAFDPSERNVPDTSNRLFVPASTNKYHVDQCVEVGRQFEEFIDGIFQAIATAWQQWMMGATLTMAMINGPTATITPGGLMGPPFMPLAMPLAPKTTPMLAKYSVAVLTAIGNAWTAWQTGWTGTLTYPPTFAACPMPVHPPTPNMPATLRTAGSSPGESMFEVNTLKGAMVAQLGMPTAPHHQELFESIATSFKKHFDLWLSQTPIKCVLGTGPVPSYAPPFVPVGPVVVGMGNGIPGAMLT